MTTTYGAADPSPDAYHHIGDNLPAHDRHDAETVSESVVDRYWSANLKLLGALLAIWFAVSFGAGILSVDLLNKIEVGGFKLGFWFAQQGAIYVFVVLIFVYAHRMHRIERRFGVDDD